ncbi:hypothetical protein ACFS32_21385 [Novosphingobium pokkalii]|uniref:hypothetical protein n=1 Tax=Novosphingobium pokkalii TaxID=1770194 RepID=UPI00363F7F10
MIAKLARHEGVAMPGCRTLHNFLKQRTCLDSREWRTCELVDRVNKCSNNRSLCDVFRMENGLFEPVVGNRAECRVTS